MSAPGLKKRVRSDGTIAWYWVAAAVSRTENDYPLRTRRIVAETEEEAEAQAWELTSELRVWLGERGTTVSFDGTLGSLIACYTADRDSPYGSVRENTRASYDHDLKILKAHLATKHVASLTRRDFAQWHRHFIEPKVKEGPRRVRRAHGLMTMLRGVLSFGVSMRFAGCKAAKEVLDEMRFEMPERRGRAMTFAQASAIIDKAIELGVRSIALGQAVQFELGLRQIDVIGYWLDGPQWTGGVSWADLTADRLAKRTSKTGQEGQWRPSDYPLLVKAIAAFAEIERVGVGVVDERTGKPYGPGKYSRRWRGVAQAAGVPDDVWNMDSRAGAITEASEAGANPEDVRQFATHADHQTTQRYIRRTAEATTRVAELRVKNRNKEPSERGGWKPPSKTGS